MLKENVQCLLNKGIDKIKEKIEKNKEDTVKCAQTDLIVLGHVPAKDTLIVGLSRSMCVEVTQVTTPTPF
jgi:hypothetical protein